MGHSLSPPWSIASVTVRNGWAMSAMPAPAYQLKSMAPLIGNRMTQECLQLLRLARTRQFDATSPSPITGSAEVTEGWTAPAHPGALHPRRADRVDLTIDRYVHTSDAAPPGIAPAARAIAVAIFSPPPPE